jgi:two-component system probable response regulator PhcQ
MKHKLLIVDDEPMIYHALRRALHSEVNLETLYAESGDDALRLLESEAVDVIIADENMPGMNGSQLLCLVRQRWPEIIRMMLTGDPSIDVVMNAVNRGEIFRFFTKPCNEAELITSIRDALQMRDLKAGSRELLDTVKKQSAHIRDLESPELPAHVEPVKGPSGSQDRPTLSLDSPVESSPSDEPFDLEIDDDVDSLLSEIRKELDSLT